MRFHDDCGSLRASCSHACVVWVGVFQPLYPCLMVPNESLNHVCEHRFMLTMMWLNLLQVQHVTLSSSLLHTTHTHTQSATSVGDTHAASLSAAEAEAVDMPEACLHLRRQACCSCDMCRLSQCPHSRTRAVPTLLLTCPCAPSV